MKVFALLVFIIGLAASSVNATAQNQYNSTEILVELRNKYSVKLESNTINNINKNCETTKTTLKGLQLTNDSAVRKRLLVYSDIQKELKAIEIRLTKQGADASELDLLIGKMQQLIESLNQNSRIHLDIVTSLTAVDCKNNPDLFAAGMYELRYIRSVMQKTSEELKSTIEDSKESTFKPLTDRLML